MAGRPGLRLGVAMFVRALWLVAAPPRMALLRHRSAVGFAGLAGGSAVAATVPTLALSMPKPIEVSRDERPTLRSRRKPVTPAVSPPSEAAAGGRTGSSRASRQRASRAPTPRAPAPAPVELSSPTSEPYVPALVRAPKPANRKA